MMYGGADRKKEAKWEMYYYDKLPKELRSLLQSADRKVYAGTVWLVYKECGLMAAKRHIFYGKIPQKVRKKYSFEEGEEQ